MNDRAKLARFAIWNLFREAAAQTTGSGSALHRAAVRSALGRDPAGLKFSAIAARLPAEDRRRLLDRITELDVERAKVGRAA